MRRVGILNPTRVVGCGGGFQYLLSLIAALSGRDDLDVVVFYDDPAFAQFCREFPVEGVQLPLTAEPVGRVVRALCTLCERRSPFLGRFSGLRRHQLDCLVSASSLAGFHLGIPLVAIVYDVMYKYFPGCAEYSFRERIARDVLTRKLARVAQVTVVDSEKSKQDLVRFYGLDPARIRPIPLCPPPHVGRGISEQTVRDVAAKYGLPDRFLFYPAQLWDHKNHRRLFEALARLKDRDGIEIPAVLVGSRGERGECALKDVETLGLARQIHYLGYVSEDELLALYGGATALVFPSFGDYTNIPVLEAMALGTPVVCSNLFAMPEQIDGAGLLFNPFDVDEMASQIHRIWRDTDLRADLARRGRKRVSALSMDAFAARWHDVVQEAAHAC